MTTNMTKLRKIVHELNFLNNLRSPPKIALSKDKNHIALSMKKAMFIEARESGDKTREKETLSALRTYVLEKKR